jgi:putative spermidine/putrescine transport system permease protein
MAKTSVTLKILVFLICALLLLPLPVLIWMSLFKQSYLTVPPVGGYSTIWYAELPEQTQLFTGFVTSLKLGLCVVIVSTVIGAAAAFGVRKSKGRLRVFSENLISLPLTVPALVSSMALYIVLFKVGDFIGVNLASSFLSLVFAHVLITLPWAYRLTFAGVVGIDPDIEKASESLGASGLTTFLKVTLPMSLSSIFSAATMVFIFSLGALEMSMFLVSPSTTTLPVAMMAYSQIKVDPTIAAMAVVQLAIVGGLLLIGTKLFGFGKVLSGGVKQ